MRVASVKDYINAPANIEINIKEKAFSQASTSRMIESNARVSTSVQVAKNNTDRNVFEVSRLTANKVSYDELPTEIAAATQLMQLTAAPAKNTYLANVTYEWVVSLELLTITALQASADNAYDDVWRIRFGATASTALAIQPTVYWEGGDAPSFTTWGICELEFRKDSSSGAYLGRWRVYK